jgi:DNA repair protein RecO (recombination protein O)
MGTVETEAVIIRAYRLSEADKIVVSLTRGEGMIRGVARGARRLKSQFGASLEPFTHVSLSFYVKEGRELVNIKRAEIIKSYFTLSSQHEALTVLEHFGQLLIEFAPPHQPDEKLYRLILACLDAANADPESVQAIHPYFELWVLKLTGFLPDLKVCGGCGRALKAGLEAVNMTAEGALRCGACAGGMPFALSHALHGQLSSLNRLRPTEWARRFQALPAADRDRLAGLVARLTLRALERQPGPNKIQQAAYKLMGGPGLSR